MHTDKQQPLVIWGFSAAASLRTLCAFSRGRIMFWTAKKHSRKNSRNTKTSTNSQHKSFYWLKSVVLCLTGPSGCGWGRLLRGRWIAISGLFPNSPSRSVSTPPPSLDTSFSSSPTLQLPSHSNHYCLLYVYYKWWNVSSYIFLYPCSSYTEITALLTRVANHDKLNYWSIDQFIL